MKLKFMRQFLILMAVTFLGEALRAVLPFSVPAGIYGLLLLFAGLCTGVVPLESVEGAADFLIEIMPFFFIPAGVGLMTEWPELKKILLPFSLAVVVVTAVVMVVTGRVSQWFIRRQRKRGGKGCE